MYFFWSQSSPFLFQYSADERFYIEFARHILRADQFQYANFMDPLLAYVLAAILSVIQHDLSIRFVFMLIDCVNVVLIFYVALAIFKNKTSAFIAALLYGFYGLAIVYSVFITKTTLLNALLLFQALMLCKAYQTSSKRLFILAGVLSILILQLGAAFMLLLLIQCLILIKCFNRERYLFSYLLGCILTIVAYSGMLSIVDSNKTILPNNGDIVFYISNHAANDVGMHISPAFVKESTPVAIYEAFQQHIPADITAQERKHYWYIKAVEENFEHPHMLLVREWRKLMLFVANDEISQNYYFPYIFNETLKRIPFVNFAFICAFALLGITSIKKWEFQHWVLLAPMFATFLICMIFFMSARMRFPFVPFLIIFAAHGAISLTSISFKKLALLLVIFCLSMGVGVLYSHKETDQDRYNLAVSMQSAGLFSASEKLIDELLLHSELGKYRFLKATLLARQGKCELALPLFDKLIKEQQLMDGLQENRQLCYQFLQSKQN